VRTLLPKPAVAAALKRRSARSASSTTKPESREDVHHARGGGGESVTVQRNVRVRKSLRWARMSSPLHRFHAEEAPVKHHEDGSLSLLSRSRRRALRLGTSDSRSRHTIDTWAAGRIRVAWHPLFQVRAGFAYTNRRRLQSTTRGCSRSSSRLRRLALKRDCPIQK